MTSKNLLLYGGIIGMIAIIAVVSISLAQDYEIKTQETSIYIPSNITKANPNILIGTGSSSWRTTNISDVADTVSITVTGTVLEVGDPIHWFDSRLPNSDIGHGSVPVTISVEQVYKGEIQSKTFTFYLEGMLRNWELKTIGDSIRDVPPEDRIFYLFPWEPQFEIGEKVLLHITYSPPSSNAIIEKDDFDLLSQSPYSVQLGKYGKYHIPQPQIQSANNLDILVFNEKYPEGIKLSTAISQSESQN